MVTAAKVMVVAVAAVTPLACGSAATEVDFPSVSGDWFASSPSIVGWEYAFTLTEAPDGTVSGIGRDVDSPTELVVGAARHAFPRFSLQISVANDEVRFDGLVSSDGNTIVGQVEYQTVLVDLVFERLK